MSQEEPLVRHFNKTGGGKDTALSALQSLHSSQILKPSQRNYTPTAKHLSSLQAKETLKVGFAPASLNQPPQEEQLPGSADHLDWLVQPRIAGAVPVCLQ